MTKTIHRRGGRAHRRRARASWLAITALALATALPGCADEAPSEVESYIDSAGRSCSVDLADISRTATCDAEPSWSCNEGQEAAFILSDDYDFATGIWTQRSCGACIDRAERTSFVVSEACANVSCETDADCLTERFTCMGGACLDTST